MSGKTNKAAQKRFKVTKKGKVMYRPRNQSHFRAKKSSDSKRDGRSEEELARAQSNKIKKQYLPHH